MLIIISNQCHCCNGLNVCVPPDSDAKHQMPKEGWPREEERREAGAEEKQHECCSRETGQCRGGG